MKVTEFKDKWWVGQSVKCWHCLSVVELEDGDSISLSTDPSYPQIVAEFHCPTCRNRGRTSTLTVLHKHAQEIYEVLEQGFSQPPVFAVESEPNKS